MNTKLLILMMCVLFYGMAKAQRDMSWQGEYPSPILDWSLYVTLAPGYMGPSALPVPTVYEGEVESKAEFVGGVAYYKNTLGDAPTFNTNTRFYYPVVDRRVALEFVLMPFEKFSYSDEVADIFHSQHTSGRGPGDFYINSYFQIVRQTNKWPDMTIRYGLRTASGSNVNDARHTDTPGYFMDLTVGKDVFTEGNQRVRFYAMAGFYCWQLLDFQNMQNDAHLYGAGFSYHNERWVLKWNMGGYHGYHNSGDTPLVMRAQADIPVSKQFTCRFLYEQGLNDYPYKAYHFKAVYTFGPSWFRD